MPAVPEPPATATAGEPCTGVTTPQTVHRTSDTPVTTRFDKHTTAFTRRALIGLVDAPIPADAQPCAECHQGTPLRSNRVDGRTRQAPTSTPASARPARGPIKTASCRGPQVQQGTRPAQRLMTSR
ncbi:hypothetical protein GCM10009754_87280 [Amycolatopsis minnesotensis]|uniref:Uncharacterized protein n=1 Tax=Amycolatopsis minnesotensis TaxID=337894 RepID=A0ABN2SZQ5_9PSEU